MSVTRRGFLGMLAGTAVSGFSASGATPSTVKKSRNPTGMSPSEELLIKFYLPMLKRSEAKSWSLSTLLDDGTKDDETPQTFSFYHKSGDKVTVGYGVNVEAHPELLDDIPIYHYGKELLPEERKKFLADMTKMERGPLEQYTIKAEDAEYLSKKAMLKIMRSTQRILADEKAGKVSLYDLPFCMQALAVDVCYNVGEGKFWTYKKFKAALKERNYEKALAESVVYTNKETKAVNKKREWAKKRLLAIMRIVHDNPSLSQDKINQLIKENYEANTTTSMRMLNRHTKLPHEQSVAIGELYYVKRSLLKAKQAQQTSKKSEQSPTPKSRSVQQTSSKKRQISMDR